MTHHTDAERAEFEAWARDVGLPLDQAGCGLYAKTETQAAWMAWQWQAGRRAPAAPVQMPEPEAKVHAKVGTTCMFSSTIMRKGDTIYTEQQVRDLLAAAKVERKPLTDSDIGEILDKREDIAERADGGGWHLLPYAFARAIERAHGIGKDKA